MYRIFEIKTNELIHETEQLRKAKDFAELYKKNFGKDSRIQHCQDIWSTQTLDQIIPR